MRIGSNSSHSNPENNNDFRAIINDSNLFWQTFCQAVQLDGDDKDSFNVCEPAIKTCLEEIRKIFSNHVDSREDFIILQVKIFDDIYIKKHKNGLIDLHNWEREPSISKNEFDNFIKPFMADFCKSLGAQCHNFAVAINLITSCDEQQNAHAFKIDRKK